MVLLQMALVPQMCRVHNGPSTVGILRILWFFVFVFRIVFFVNMAAQEVILFIQQTLLITYNMLDTRDRKVNMTQTLPLTSCSQLSGETSINK